MVTFDCGSLDRLRELGGPARSAAERGRLIVLDHHRTNEGYGSVNVIDPSAAATAVVVRQLADRLGWRLNRDAAMCLYTGLVTDTGRFQYEATLPRGVLLGRRAVLLRAPDRHDEPSALRGAPLRATSA